MSVSMKYAPHQRPSGRKGPLDILSNLFRRPKDVSASGDYDDNSSDRSGSDVVVVNDVAGRISCSCSPSRAIVGRSPASFTTSSYCEVGDFGEATDPLSSVDLILNTPSLTDDTLSTTSICSSPAGRSPRSPSAYARAHRVLHNFDREVEETLRLSRHDNPVVQRKLASCLAAMDTASEGDAPGTSYSSRSEVNAPATSPPSAALLLHPSPRDSYSPFDDIQQHLVRSPPPCIATLRTFTYDSDGYRSGGDESCDLCLAPDEEGDLENDDDVFCGAGGLRQVRNAPLPHVKQSCPMFRPLTSVQKCIFQESRIHRDNKKQPKDLKPLLSRSSNDVIDLRTRMFEVHQRQREIVAAGNSTNLCSSVPTSPLMLAVTRRKRHLSTPTRPMTYPSQKTL